MIDKAKTEKHTTRTGKRIGMKNRATVSIKVNDSDRNVSRMWELLKRHFSQKKVTSSELGRMVFLRGMIAVLEEIELENKTSSEKEFDERQGRLL